MTLCIWRHVYSGVANPKTSQLKWVRFQYGKTNCRVSRYSWIRAILIVRFPNFLDFNHNIFDMPWNDKLIKNWSKMMTRMWFIGGFRWKENLPKKKNRKVINFIRNELMIIMFQSPCCTGLTAQKAHIRQKYEFYMLSETPLNTSWSGPKSFGIPKNEVGFPKHEFRKHSLQRL